MSRSEALERYRSLPLPTTSEESWRFTDLSGFDPDAFAGNGRVRGSDAGLSADAMVAVESVAAATVTEDGIVIERAPDGITFEPLTGHELLGHLVGANEKFAAHNAAEWQHGL